MSRQASIRPEIASSWRRTSASGLDPGARVDPGEAVPVDPASRLLRAAAPVLDGLAAVLDQAQYTVMLADREARLVALRFGCPALRPALEQVGAVIGRSFTEDTTGTNSIATAFEMRRGVAVHGGEHYLQSFKRFACYGTPVIDPVTGRIAAVLDITCLVQDANELLRPFLLRGARDIEARLLDTAGLGQRRLLEAFQTASCRSNEPLIAFGTDLVLTNSTGADLLQPADSTALQMLAAEMTGPPGLARRCRVDLAGGRRITGTLTAVDGGVLIRLEQAYRAAPIPRYRPCQATVGIEDWHGLDEEIEGCNARRTSVLVHGEPGTGLRTVAARLAPGPVVTVHGATASVAAGLAGDVAVHGSARATWLVTDLHLLGPEAAALLARVAEQHRPRLVLTAGADLPGPAAAVAALCPVRLALPTLRSRRDRIPSLAAAMLAAASAGRARFTAPALRALAGLDWPGNLREMRTVVDEVAARRPVGDVTESDLPTGYRGASRPQVSGALWQAERDAVVHALRTCSGNKVHAAEMLGISRNTLYRRLRTLRVNPEVLFAASREGVGTAPGMNS